MHVLVIGGTKFIGPYVVEQLVSVGHHVTVYHRDEHEPALPLGVRHVHSPAAAMPVESFPLEVREPPPAAVIHMIPMGERDGKAIVDTFRDRTSRLVALSSGDVYRAYGRLIGVEPGPPVPGLLAECSPLRTVLYPYRKQAQSPDEWIYSYDKILVERIVLGEPLLPAVVLRLPKVYGPGENADLSTVYGFRHQPNWRWTHGYVENVAHAITGRRPPLSARNGTCSTPVYPPVFDNRPVRLSQAQRGVSDHSVAAGLADQVANSRGRSRHRVAVGQGRGGRLSGWAA